MEAGTVNALVAAEDGENGANGLDALGGSNMAPFLTKLFQIVSAEATDGAIKWTPKGDSFVISDPDTFARDILPTYFKHNNIRSFIRQLNTYGFRKRTNISSTDEHLEFFHVSFRRDEPGQLTQIKRCHQSKGQTQQQTPGTPTITASVPVGGTAMSQIEDLTKPSGSSPDLEAIRSRVTELKTRLGSLQLEIRDYNQQMEQKVNLLMQILQTSSTPHGATQLQQQIARMQMTMPMGGAGNQGQQSLTNGNYNIEHPTGGIGNSFNQHLSNDYMGRRDSLLASLGHQHGIGNLNNGAVGNGLSGLVGIPGLGMSGLGGGNALGGIGGMLGNGMGVGMGNFGGMGTFGALGGVGPLGVVGQKNGGVEGGVAGLQHLLEAAQRYHTEDSVDIPGRVDASGRAAKRFCPDSQVHSEEARA